MKLEYREDFHDKQALWSTDPFVAITGRDKYDMSFITKDSLRN